MTKKDYIIVAKCLNKVYKKIELRHDTIEDQTDKDICLSSMFAITEVVGNMFAEFEKDNPRFDWQKFKAEVYK